MLRHLGLTLEKDDGIQFGTLGLFSGRSMFAVLVVKKAYASSIWEVMSRTQHFMSWAMGERSLLLARGFSLGLVHRTRGSF
jgi:hypothetical protein